MKFQLTSKAPLEVTRSMVAINPKTGLRQHKAVTFTQGVVYDTEDFKDEYPQFAESVLDIKQQIANANNITENEYLKAYGSRLTVNKCGKCGGTKATLLFPIFEETK